MLRGLIAILLSASFVGASAQRIFSVDYPHQADVKVYVTDNESRADLVVYTTNNEQRAISNDNNGIWYYTNQASRADKKIYFVNYESQADLVVFFTSVESRAGWRRPVSPAKVALLQADRRR